MELPQSRPFGTEGKKPTHDFLSLYNHSSFPLQDPRPSSQGIYLKTRDFLQPLEMVGKSIGNAKETESSAAAETSRTYSNNEKAAASVPAPAPRPPSSSSSSSVEHVLPGGIGTYTISHISSFSHPLQVPKPERPSTCAPLLAIPASACSTEKKMSSTNTTTNHEVNKAVSNSASSYSGGSFSLWGESVVEKGAAKKAITSAERQVTREVPTESLGQWSSEQQQQLLQTPYNILSNSFSSLPSSKETSRKSQSSFMEMMKSGKGLQEDEDDEDDFPVKKDFSSQKELTVKVDGKSIDQKANTPRSKHSATEQRRRSKINDRFQILRDLIPLNDQKRDKASFLLEVIEYIQFLQEKVNKYEGSYQGWNQESAKLMPWRNKHGPGESMAHHSRAMKNGPGPGLIFAGKYNDNGIPITPPILANAPTPVDNDQRTGATYKSIDHLLADANKAIPFPVQIHPDIVTPVGRSSGLAQPLQRPLCDGENMASQPESHLWQSLPCTTGCPTVISKEQEAIPIEGGTISISNVYSQGLLNNLTQALQRSGVDLSLASISVQIDLGKHKISKLGTTASAKDHVDPSSSNRARSRGTSSGDDSDRTRKRLKTEHN